MLPFENNIYEVEISGAALVANLEQAVSSCSPQSGCYPGVGGMSFSSTGESLEVTLANGATFDPSATYRILVNDFMYHGGDGYSFESHDPTPYDTAVSIRQPVIDWTAGLETSAVTPLENYLDPAPRD